MCKKTPTLVRAPAVERRRVTFRRRYSGEVLLKAVALAVAASFIAMAPPAIADPAGAPTKDRVFFNCTFEIADLLAVLDLHGNDNKFAGFEASYFIIYTRANPNNGQLLASPPAAANTYTGPVLCTSATENITQTPDTAPIPNPTNNPGVVKVDVLSNGVTTDIQYLPKVSDTEAKPKEKRVCVTAGPNVDCFVNQPQTP